MVTKPLPRIRHEIGHAYIAATGHPELSSHNRPSAAIVLENGTPLPGPGNALHEDIRRLGSGRYSFWHGRVYFSTPDNSDPTSNGRTYTIGYTQPPVYGIANLTPHSWYRLGAAASRRVAGLLRNEKWQLAAWDACYWACFARVLCMPLKRPRRG